jgi:hypothetical protein
MPGAADWQRAARQVVRSLGDDGCAAEATQVKQFTAGGASFHLPGQILNPDWFP